MNSKMFKMDNENTNVTTEHSRKICPACKNGYLSRIHREPWMTWISSSKYYSCSKCKAYYLRIYDRFQFKVNGKHSSYSKRDIAILVLVIVFAILVCWRLVINLY